MNESRINLAGTNGDKTAESLGCDANQSTARFADAGEIADRMSQGSPSSPAISLPAMASAARTTNTIAEERKAESDAAVCREFAALRAQGLSLNQAAVMLGRSPSWFSGPNAPYTRWQREGRAGLLPQGRRQNIECRSEVTRQIAALGWFIPAAKYFNLILNRTYNSGSVPEAIRRTISLPNVPTGWTNALKEKFLAYLNAQLLNSSTPQLLNLPECPPQVREAILAREKDGLDLVPESVAKQIALPPSIVRRTRSPRAWSLDTLSAPGSQRRYFSAERGGRVIMEPGDWFGGDDATPGIAVCVPCSEVITPSSQKYGVLLGRFQWLVFNDCRTDKILGWDYVVRPRGGYRAEDILSGMGTVVKTHGIPEKGWQFEGGTFNAHLVRDAIALMKCEHWRTYSPHQKAVESVFNRVWTRLAAQFPHADMGRYRNENEANCKVYENCRRGHADPRRYFPSIQIVTQMFDEEVAAHNARLIISEQYGRWVPDELFAQKVAERQLRAFSEEMQWIFSPFACERKITGMMVRCRVPMFEDFSVPFEFNAEWMPLHDKKRVRLHFNPRDPKCRAKIVLLENSGQFKTGTVLGDADLIGETTGHIRLIMNWADDNQRAGYVARQKTNHFMRRISRGIGAGGRVVYASDERRDGIGQVQKIERSEDGSQKPEPAEVGRATPCAPTEITPQDRTARKAELDAFERENQHLFL